MRTAKCCEHCPFMRYHVCIKTYKDVLRLTPQGFNCPLDYSGNGELPLATLYKDRNWLYEQYVTEELSFMEIANLCKCSDKTVYSWAKKLNIPIRSISDTVRLRYRKKTEKENRDDKIYDEGQER